MFVDFISPEQITILTCRGYESSIFYKKDKVGRYKLSKVKERIDQDTKIAEPEYDHAGNLKYSDGDIFYNSVNKYKGDESPVVILVDIDQDKIKEKVLASVLLCGMTRATLKLHLLVKKN